MKTSFHLETDIRRRWWKESIAYQIYPRSFQDTNGDGIGDIRGIIQRLDHIKSLGVDLIWICPIYKSPNDDNGYDISDYQQIMDTFGNMQDVEDLIKSVHDRKMRIIFDLVLNHTSDEHPWFIESRSSRTSSKRDWYIWRDGQPNGIYPNNWESIFNGTVWEYDKQTDQYYLHLFSRKMPDVNWECAELREELYKVTRWWLDRGIDGFRIDAISHVKKKPGLPDLPNPKQLEFVSSFDYHMNVEGIEEHLKEFRQETYDKYDVVTVGEANGVNAEQAVDWVDEEHGIFNMIFQFEATNLWDDKSGTLDILAFKRIMTRWQIALEKNGWNALFIENHDRPRIVSAWGNDKDYWRDCATAFATVYMLMTGTPFIYQGQEIGMTNVNFSSIDDYRDVAAKNFYNHEMANGTDHDEIMKNIHLTGRDNSRTPMQWDDSFNAGFSKSEKPWIGVNSNYTCINVSQQEKDKNSILNFYKRLIRLKKENDLFIYGTYDLILSYHKQIYGYTRTSDIKRAYILTNLTDSPAKFTLRQQLSLSQLVLSNSIVSIPEHKNENTFEFRPYEIRVYVIDYENKKRQSRYIYRSKSHTNDDLRTLLFTPQRPHGLDKLEQMSIDAENDLKSREELTADSAAIENEQVVPTFNSESNFKNKIIEHRNSQQSIIVIEQENLNSEECNDDTDYSLLLDNSIGQTRSTDRIKSRRK